MIINFVISNIIFLIFKFDFYCIFSQKIPGKAEKLKMASRKRPRGSTKPDTPTNGLDSSLREIDLQNGSNSSMEDSNGHSKTNGDDLSSIKHALNRPVSCERIDKCSKIDGDVIECR